MAKLTIETEAIDLTRWKKECDEYSEICAEMQATGKQPSAYQVGLEQRKRMLARGDRPMFPPVRG